MTKNATHDPSLDHIDFPLGRWLVLEEGDTIQDGDLFCYDGGTMWSGSVLAGIKLARTYYPYIRPI